MGLMECWLLAGMVTASELSKFSMTLTENGERQSTNRSVSNNERSRPAPAGLYTCALVVMHW